MLLLTLEFIHWESSRCAMACKAQMLVGNGLDEGSLLEVTVLREQRRLSDAIARLSCTYVQRGLNSGHRLGPRG